MRSYALLTMLAAAAPATASPGWTTAAPLPTPRRGAVGAIVKSKMIVVGGNNPEIAAAGHAVEIYDPLSEAWSDGPALTMSRSDAGACPSGHRMYVAGGMGPSGGNISSVEYLDLDEQKNPTWAWHEAAPLPEARRGLALAPITGEDGSKYLWAIGGMNCMHDCYSTPVAFTKRVDIYNVALDSWVEGPPMNVGRRDHGTAVVNGKVYVVGGCGGDGARVDYTDCTPLASIEMFDPVVGKWVLLPPMPQPRHGGHVASFGTDIIVLAGTTHAGIDAMDAAKGLTNTVLWFDTINNVWQEISPAMPDPRDGVVKGYGLQIGIVVFVVGGSDKNGNYVGQTDQYALRC